MAEQFKKSKQSKPKKLRRKVREKFTLEAQGGDGGADKSKDHGSRASKEMTAKEKEGHADNRRREEGFARAQAKAAEASKSLSEFSACSRNGGGRDCCHQILWLLCAKQGQHTRGNMLCHRTISAYILRSLG